MSIPSSGSSHLFNAANELHAPEIALWPGDRYSGAMKNHSKGTARMNNPANADSRNVPLPIQREVRQRCGFGCVICGMPLYEYEHLEGWANVHRHVADEITLLCDRHHREKTAGLLPIQDVKSANAAPLNLRQGSSSPYRLHFSGPDATVWIGNNNFSGQLHDGLFMYPLIIDQAALIGFAFEAGHLLLTLNVFDEHNFPVLIIENNHLKYSVDTWDIQFVARNLIIRVASRNILIELEFRPPSEIAVLRGRFLLNGVEVLVRKDDCSIVNTGDTFSGTTFLGALGGLVLGPMNVEIPSMYRRPYIPRYGVDRKTALRDATS